MPRAINISLNLFLWVFFSVTSILYFLGAVFLRLITPAFDPNLKILHRYSCFWASNYIWVNPFWSVKVTGKENADPKKVYVMVSNHQSIVDILVAFRTFLHFKWVSKKSMFKTPLIGWNMTLNGYVPIERGDAASRERCLEACRRWITKGSSVFFFPEGTRSKDGYLASFKPGAFRLALETGTDILPIVILGSRDAVPKHSALLHRQSRMVIKILPSVSVAPFKNENLDEGVERLTNHVYEIIKQEAPTLARSSAA